MLGKLLGRQKAPSTPPRDESSKGSAAAKSALTVNEFVARTKRGREKGLEPTKPELIAYARYLGIDPITDADLMWIVDEALKAPLPSEWTEHHDSADRIFYYNVQTHASSWTHPLEQMHRDIYKSIVGFRGGDLSKKEKGAELERMRRSCEEAEREAHKELQAWSEHIDNQGQKFYYNREDQRSVWTDPRPARCHALYLQMKAVRELGRHCGQTYSARDPEPLMPAAPPLAQAPHTDRGGRHNTGGFGGIQPLSLGGTEGASMQEESREERKHRKKRKDHELAGMKAPLDDSLGGMSGGMLGMPGAPALDLRKDALDLKKPPLSAVEEVRAALGVSEQRLPQIGGRSSLGGGPMARLPSPPGDGLRSVGRNRVRAGIKLEPLQSALS